MQVLGVLDAILHKIGQDFPQIKETMIGSDNTSCLALHDSIPYIYILNKRMTNLKVKIWVYTEACTGKHRLDSYLSFVNLTLTGYLMDGGNICNGDDIYAALRH